MNRKIFGQRLRDLRKRKTTLTVKEFGNKFNLAESTISGYENGARMPDTGTLQKFADYFDVSIDYLLGRIDDEKPINVAFRDGGESLTKEEEEYLHEQLETFRRMKKRFMEQRNKEKN